MRLPPIVWLGDVAHGRDNNVRLLRHLAALAVILFHCYALNLRWDEDPIAKLTGAPVDLGSIGVQVFFALSGFLIAQSWCQHPSARQFIEARVLRIYPALIAAVIFTVLVGWPTSRMPLAHYLTDPQTVYYLWRTSTGIEGTLPLPIFPDNPYPRAPNGSLWTLPVELRLYVGMLAMGAFGVLARPRLTLPIALVATVLLVYVPGPISLLIDSVRIRSLAIIFICGALAYVWRDRLPLSIVGALVLLAFYLGMGITFLRAVITLPMIAYITLVLAYHPRLRISRLAKGPDFSYGLYVYAFPIQQLVLWRWPGIGIAGLFLAATPVIAAVAAMSWYGLERPALALKRRVRATAVAAARPSQAMRTAATTSPHADAQRPPA